MLVDTHCHLFFKDFHEDLPAVLDRARAAEVFQIIVPGTDLETSRTSIELSERYKGLFACVGIHPHDAKSTSDVAMQELEDLLHHPSVVAVGEIGLDFHYDLSPRETQRSVFRSLLELAVKAGKPVVIHTRESVEETIEVCREFVSAHPEWLPMQEPSDVPRRGVFHCFSGTVEQARTLRTLGFFVSYPGIVTFKNASAMSVVKELGTSKILLETDAPFMAPVPFRGKRNEPAHVALIAEAIARAANVDRKILAHETTQNAVRLFSLPPTLTLE